MSVARGKYVVFWDADDVFMPEALEEMYNRCEEDKADICVCGANHYDEVSDTLIKIGTYLKMDKVPEKIPFSKNENGKYLFNFSTNVPWNKMFRKDFITENGIEFQKIKQANDNFFVMCAFFEAKAITVVDKELINYRINYSTSLTGNASDTPMCVYEAYKKTYDTLKNRQGFELVKQSFLNKTLRGFCYFLTKQSKAESYRELYNKYKEAVFTQWGFPDDEDFYYVEKDYDRYSRVLKLDAEEYLLSEYKNAFDELRLVREKKNRRIDSLKEKRDSQKEKISNLKEKNKSLKEKNAVLSARLKNIQQSRSYKIGRIITYIPRKLKNLFK